MKRILLSLVAVLALGASSADARPSRGRIAFKARVDRVFSAGVLRVRPVKAPNDHLRVRLLGVKTPRTKPAECGGRELTGALLGLTFTGARDTDGDGLLDRRGGKGRGVLLVTDRAQRRFDSSGRLLAYVTPKGRRMLQRSLLGAGWVKTLREGRRFGQSSSFRSVERKARKGRLGAYGLCGGRFDAPAPFGSTATPAGIGGAPAQGSAGKAPAPPQQSPTKPTPQPPAIARPPATTAPSAKPTTPPPAPQPPATKPSPAPAPAPKPAPAPAPKIAPAPKPAPTPTPTPTPVKIAPVTRPSPSPLPPPVSSRSPLASSSLAGANVTPVFRDSGGRFPRTAYDELKRQGFRIARFVLFWDRAEPSRGNFSPSYLSTLDAAIADACAPTRNAFGTPVPGARVVLDAIHLYGPNGGMSYVPDWAKAAGGDSVTVVSREGGRFLQMLARRYRDNPCVTALEPVNEPFRYPVDNTAVLRMFSGLIGQIRSQAPGMTVVIEPSYGDTDSGAGCADFSALTRRDNVVWSFHDYYLGGAGDGYDSDCTQGDQRLYGWNGANGYPGGRAADIRAHVARAVSGPRAAGLPVWVGEYGIGSEGREAWIGDTRGAFKALGLGASWWEWHTGASFSATDSSYRAPPWASALVR